MLQKLDKLRQQIIRALGDDGILILPTWPTVAPFHWQQVFTPYNVSITQIVNVLGFPAVACPLGLDPASGLPVGVQILGPPNSEPLLMAAAIELERGFGGWVRP
jgi:fatty acid amide hydrolase 2